MRRGTSFGCGSREDIHNNPDPSLPTQYVRKDSRVKVSEEPPRTIPRTVSKFNAQFGPAPPPPGPAVVQKVTNMRRTRSDPVQLQSRVLPILGVSEESEDSKPIPIKRTVSLAMGFQKIPEDWSALPTISEGVSMGSSELVNRSLKAINNYGDDEILPPPDEEEEISPPQKRVSKPFDASVKVKPSEQIITIQLTVYTKTRSQQVKEKKLHPTLKSKRNLVGLGSHERIPDQNLTLEYNSHQSLLMNQFLLLMTNTIPHTPQILLHTPNPKKKRKRNLFSANYSDEGNPKVLHPRNLLDSPSPKQPPRVSRVIENSTICLERKH